MFPEETAYCEAVWADLKIAAARKELKTEDDDAKAKEDNREPPKQLLRAHHQHADSDERAAPQ
jgi:hypothetical protein